MCHLVNVKSLKSGMETASVCMCVWFSGEGQDFVLVDAPVSGGVVKAANGSLTVSSFFFALKLNHRLFISLLPKHFCSN